MQVFLQLFINNKDHSCAEQPFALMKTKQLKLRDYDFIGFYYSTIRVSLNR